MQQVADKEIIILFLVRFYRSGNQARSSLIVESIIEASDPREAKRIAKVNLTQQYPEVATCLSDHVETYQAPKGG